MRVKADCAGATCLATEFPILAGNRFAIVILDECSQVGLRSRRTTRARSRHVAQMVEPLSLLPIARFGGEAVVAVGDPHQASARAGGEAFATRAPSHGLPAAASDADVHGAGRGQERRKRA
jgi:hypothetical protein